MHAIKKIILFQNVKELIRGTYFVPDMHRYAMEQSKYFIK